MGRTNLALAFAIVAGFAVCSPADAWWGKDEGKEADKGAGSTPAAPRAPGDRERSARDKAMKDWQAKLSNSRWELEVTVSSGGPATVVQSDILKFERGMMRSETLEKDGFERAPYALYPPTDTSVEWEAMQKKTADGTEESAIWRGEITGDAIRGTMVKRIAQGDTDTTQTFSFSGRLMAPEPEPAPEPAVAAPAPASDGQPADPVAAPVSAPAAEPAKKSGTR